MLINLQILLKLEPTVSTGLSNILLDTISKCGLWRLFFILTIILVLSLRYKGLELNLRLLINNPPKPVIF